jgi:hypothetical protein
MTQDPMNSVNYSPAGDWSDRGGLERSANFPYQTPPSVISGSTTPIGAGAHVQTPPSIVITVHPEAPGSARTALEQQDSRHVAESAGS